MLANGIRHGIKLLVIEKSFGSIGISALLAPNPGQIVKLQYTEIADFLELLKDSGCQDIQLLSKTKSTWLRECQDLYSSMYDFPTIFCWLMGNSTT